MAAEKAAQLYKAAEDVLLQEVDVDEALRLANEALGAFWQAGDQCGAADALRIVLHVRRSKNELKEASELAQSEMEKFKGSGDTLGEAKMMLSLAEINYDKRGPELRDAAVQWARTARSTFKAQGARKLEVLALIALVNARLKKAQQQDLSIAWQEGGVTPVEEASEAADIARQLGERKLQATALSGLAAGRILCGDHQLAIRAGKEALAIHRELGLIKCVAHSLQLLATWQVQSGSPSEAEPRLQEAATLYRELRSPAGEVRATSTMVQALVMQGKHSEAVDAAQEARLRFHNEHAKDAEACMAQAMMWALAAAGRTEEALVIERECVPMFKALGDKRREAALLITAARLQGACRRMNRAVQAAQRALAICEEHKFPEKASALEVLEEIYLLQSNADKALHLATQQRNMFKAQGDRKGEAIGMINCAVAMHHKKQTSEAIALLNEARDLLHDSAAPRQEAMALQLLVNLHFERDEFEHALRAAVAAKALLRELGDDRHEAEMSLAIARAIINRLWSNPKRVAADMRDRALGAARESVGACRRLGDNGGDLMAPVLTVAAQIYYFFDRVNDSLAASNEALPLWQVSADDLNEGYALIIAAKSNISLDRSEQAQDQLYSAIACFEKVEDKAASDGGIAAAREWLQSLEEPEQQVEETEMDEAAAKPLAVKVPKVDYSLVSGKVAQITKQVIGAGGEMIQNDDPLLNVGLTSMSSAMLRDALARDFPSVNLPVTLAFDYPSINDMAQYLAERIKQ